MGNRHFQYETHAMRLQRRVRNFNILSWIVILSFFLGIFVSVYAAIQTSPFAGTVIRDSERVCTGGQDGKCQYLVFFDVETMTNADSLVHLKFNSSDLHPMFVKGAQCHGTANWFRVPILSMYRNIITVTCKAPE